MYKLKQKKIAIASAAIYILTKDNKKKRSKWVKDWKLNRHKFSDITLLRELEENNPDDYKNYLRMDSKDFQFLLELIGPNIRKQDTVMRAAISAEERLIATLRFLATGRSYEDLKFSTCISAPSLSFIIPETCKAIFEALQMDYMKVIINIFIFITLINTSLILKNGKVVVNFELQITIKKTINYKQIFGFLVKV